ncbi:hypothetical protein DITRI_Ditri18aG0016800 [Diplodiscus trichospermus]
MVVNGRDNDTKFGKESSTKSVSTTALTQRSSVHGVPYLTARISKSQFTYMFPVTAGQKFIRLHFYPADYHGFDRSNNFFSVKVALLNNFSASLTADYLGEASFVKEFCVSLRQNQSLNITFTPSMTTSYAFINGIGIVSMPTNLYYSRLDDKGLPFLGHHSHFQIDNYTALENVHRLNIGGSSIPAADDTGMYRNWYDDFFYLVPAGVVPSNTTIKLDYSKIPEYTAPEDVYRTARSMGSNTTENLLYNLTWKLLVDSEFGLHQLMSIVLKAFFRRKKVKLSRKSILALSREKAVSDKRFRIYINNKTAEAAFDVIEAIGGKGMPIYNDYVVMVGNIRDEGKHTLFIALHPNNFYSAYANAILNGLEVFKLNNSDGNLTGSNPMPEPQIAGVEQSSPKADKSQQKEEISHFDWWRWDKLVNFTQRCNQMVSTINNQVFAAGCWLDCYKGKSSAAKSSSLPDELCHRFSLDEIKAATHDFHKALIIGVGGFGNLYKGFLDDGETIAAIKRLNPESRQGVREFKIEIEMLSQLRHIHLVSFIGYCNENNEMILAYDYMINVLFEVLCGIKALDKRLTPNHMNLAYWVKNCIADGTLYQVIDPILRGKIAPECFKVFVEIALGCIQEMEVNRPLMTDVMERVGFALELQETVDEEK